MQRARAGRLRQYTTEHTYVIEQRGSQWCLLTSDKSRVLGCHGTKAEAEAQEQAIKARQGGYAAKDLFDLPGVEIFKVGTWNGDKYTAEHLDAMVAASREVGFTPPIKFGHDASAGAPALGWVENLRRVGSSLYADLVALPKLVYDAIRRRSYDRVSAEILWNLERGGKKFSRVLRGLALLGAELPAVDLAPLASFFAMPPFPAPPEGAPRTHIIDFATEIRLTREQMASLCPPCAEAMAEKHIAALRIQRDAAGAYDFDGAFKDYQGGFSQALCDKFGPAEGFRTRCAPAMDPHVDDAEAFCNSLKQWCGLMTQRGKGKSMDELKDAKAKIAELEAAKTDLEQKLLAAKAAGEGEVVVSVAQLKEMQDKVKKLEELPVLKTELEQKKTELDELGEQHRQDRLKSKVASLKIPAFRAYARIFYDLAMHVDGAKTYTLPDNSKLELSAEAIVDRWVAELNRRAEALFLTYSTVPKPIDRDEPDDLGAKIDYRVTKYLRDQKLDRSKDYKKALDAVLDADPELKLAYAQS